MNERNFTVIAADGKNISCTLSTQGEKRDRLVVLAHGLTGGPFERMHMNGRDYFLRQGYDVLRFAFYASEPGCRVLHEATLETHALDLNAVVTQVRKYYNDIFVCGHSYGGLTLLFARPDVTALSFWDSAYKPGWPAVSEIIDGKIYVTFSGKRTLIGPAMHEEAQRLLTAEAELKALAEKITTPSQIVIAGANDKHETLNQLHAHLSCEKTKTVIDGADHNFYTGETLQRLFDETSAWFGRFGAGEQRRAS